MSEVLELKTGFTDTKRALNYYPCSNIKMDFEAVSVEKQKNDLFDLVDKFLNYDCNKIVRDPKLGLISYNQAKQNFIDFLKNANNKMK